eukprot:scaffold236239_cov43-Tisochrysis_lutea.AAC.3
MARAQALQEGSVLRQRGCHRPVGRPGHGDEQHARPPEEQVLRQCAWLALSRRRLRLLLLHRGCPQLREGLRADGGRREPGLGTERALEPHLDRR